MSVTVGEPSRVAMPPAKEQRSISRWALGQIGLALRAIAQVVLVGLVVAIRRRRFHWAAFFAGTLAMSGLTALVGAVAFGPVDVLHEGRDLFLWAGWLAAMAAGGAVIA